jgi:CheY-like chemotaxis protein
MLTYKIRRNSSANMIALDAKTWAAPTVKIPGEYRRGTISQDAESGYHAGIALDRNPLRAPMHPIRVLLCNHHPIVRSGLRALLEREPEIRVVGEAANSREAVALTEYRHPDVVLLDMQVAAREISAKAQDVGVVFISEHLDEEYVTEAFKAGARGYVLADSAQSDLIRAIQVVATGARFLSPSISLSAPLPE